MAKHYPEKSLWINKLDQGIRDLLNEELDAVGMFIQKLQEKGYFYWRRERNKGLKWFLLGMFGSEVLHNNWAYTTHKETYSDENLHSFQGRYRFFGAEVNAE
jgi:hypothetical protein